MNEKDAAIITYVVYRYPKDYPEDFVIRKNYINKSGEIIPAQHLFAKNKSYENLIKTLPRNLIRFPRFTEDEPQILETWL